MELEIVVLEDEVNSFLVGSYPHLSEKGSEQLDEELVKLEAYTIGREKIKQFGDIILTTLLREVPSNYKGKFKVKVSLTYDKG